MDYNHNKIDEMILALLWMTPAGPRQPWQSHDWDAMERLHAKGYTSDPRSKAKSLAFSEQGHRRVRQLFEHHFRGKD